MLVSLWGLCESASAVEFFGAGAAGGVSASGGDGARKAALSEKRSCSKPFIFAKGEVERFLGVGR